MSEQIAVRLTKGLDGWRAESIIDFQGDQKMTISTYKGSKGLMSVATVAQHKDGMWTFEVFGDYTKRVIIVDARATEKNVRELHHQTMGSLQTLLDDARTFYKIKAAKKGS